MHNREKVFLGAVTEHWAECGQGASSLAKNVFTDLLGFLHQCGRGVAAPCCTVLVSLLKPLCLGGREGGGGEGGDQCHALSFD